ncbi:MAG: flagellar motility protein MotE (MotC chaperone) [Candidatus Latescibacterota bacterium]
MGVKKLALIFLLMIGMTLSFAAIALVMLFALKVVTSIDEVTNLLTGQMPGAESVLIKSGEIEQVQDALLLLQQHKKEIEQDVQDLESQRDSLEQRKVALGGDVTALEAQSQVGNQDEVAARKERLDQMITLYNAMRPADAAAIMDGLDDGLVLEILPRLKQRQAARILNTLSDDQRKADLSRQLVEGLTAQRGP